MEEPCSISHRPCLVAERKGRGTVRVSATVGRGAVCDGTARKHDHAQGSAEGACIPNTIFPQHSSNNLQRMINERRRRMSLKRRKVTEAGG
jgi:hypothetical protein